MNITVLLSNNFDDRGPLRDFTTKVCLVIDVIRATSTITAALGSGAERVIISPSKEHAFKIRDSFKDIVLCGEERGLKIEGFDYDNSPLQLSQLDLHGKSVVLKTTNGTKSLIKARNARTAVALSVLNLHCSVDCAAHYASETNSDILFLCSGKLGMISYDDALVAGLGIRYLMERRDNLELDDSAALVLNAALQERDIFKAFLKSRSARCAMKLGLEDDIRFSSNPNKYNLTGKLEIDSSRQELDTLFILKPCRYE